MKRATFCRDLNGLGLLVVLLLAACSSPPSGSTFTNHTDHTDNPVMGGDVGRLFADRVAGYTPTDSGWASGVDTSLALGAPGGAGDVVPLGYDPTLSLSPPRGSIVLSFDSTSPGYCIADGGGPDLIVYSSATAVWNQVMTAEVSQDGISWFQFPISVDLSNSNLQDPLRYQAGLAGVSPTIGTGPNAGGGDAFDLSDIPSLPVGFKACYVRITDAGIIVLDYGNSQPDPGYRGGAVDAVRGIFSIPKL